MENIGGRLPVSTSALGERVAFAELQCGERCKMPFSPSDITPMAAVMVQES
jgi:hypothetical protein